MMLNTQIIAKQSLDQFISTWKLIVKRFPNVDLLDRPGIATSWANIPFVFYNTLFLTETPSTAQLLRERMKAAVAYMRFQKHPGWLVVCDEMLSTDAQKELAAIADAERLMPLPLTGMECDILPLEERPIPELRFEPIYDAAVVTDFVDLNSISYNLPVQAGRSIVGERTLWNGQAYGFVAYENDRPVSTATAVVNDDYLLLLLVATRPGARRRGFAEAVIRRALNTAYERTGIRKTVLHATNAGYPVYERMGYRSTAKFTGYIPTTGMEISNTGL